MLEKWVIAHYDIKLEYRENYWRWAVSDIYSKRETTGKAEDKGDALGDALDALQRISIRDGITPRNDD